MGFYISSEGGFVISFLLIIYISGVSLGSFYCIKSRGVGWLGLARVFIYIRLKNKIKIVRITGLKDVSELEI